MSSYSPKRRVASQSRAEDKVLEKGRRLEAKRDDEETPKDRKGATIAIEKASWVSNLEAGVECKRTPRGPFKEDRGFGDLSRSYDTKRAREGGN